MLNKREMKNTTYKVLDPFTVITNKDETIRFWVPRKSKDNTMNCVAGFDVKAYPLFLDNLSKLSYLTLHSISVVDEDMSYIYILLEENTIMEDLVEDISELLYKHVENYDKRSTVYTGTRKHMD